jgi:hypothetical protein
MEVFLIFSVYFVFFTAICYNLWQFGIFYRYLIYFSRFGIFYQEMSCNPGIDRYISGVESSIFHNQQTLGLFKEWCSYRK